MASSKRTRRSARDYRFLVFSFSLLLFFYIALLVAPYRYVERVMPKGRQLTAPAWVRKRTRWGVMKSAAILKPAKCLPQAMAAHMLLGLQGYDSTIRIGVRRQADGAIGAHAWVLCEDEVIVGDDLEGLAGFSHLTDLGKA